MLQHLGVVQVDGAAAGHDLRLRRRLGGQYLLTWVIRRVTECTQLDGVILLVHASADDQQAWAAAENLVRLAPTDVPALLFEEADPVRALARALRQYRTHGVVRVRTDSPFVDPHLIDRLVVAARAYPTTDYIAYCSRDGQPVMGSPLGVGAEWLSARAFRKAARIESPGEADDPVTARILANADRFCLRLLPVPEAIDRDDVRLRVDDDEDWEHALTIYEALGPERLDWQRIAGLLTSQPAMRRRMAALNRIHHQHPR